MAKDDDLIGTAPAKKTPAKVKPAAKKTPAKAAVKAKPAKAKGSKSANGRNMPGHGAWFWPKGNPEREALKKTIVAKLKGAITAPELSEKLKIESWKTRKLIKELGERKLVKVTKSGRTFTIAPK